MIENSEIVTTDINKHGEDLHQKIDEIIKKLSSDLDEMNRRHLAFLNNREDEIKQMISEITWTIAHLEEIINLRDHHVRQVFVHVSRISYLKSTGIYIIEIYRKNVPEYKKGVFVIPLRYGAFSLTILRLKCNNYFIWIGICCHYFLLRNLIMSSIIVLNYAQ